MILHNLTNPNGNERGNIISIRIFICCLFDLAFYNSREGEARQSKNKIQKQPTTKTWRQRFIQPKIDSMKDLSGANIVVWFSCGVASAVAAKKTIEKYGTTNNVRVVNSPVYEEHVDNRRFLKDVEKWIGQEIEIVVNEKYPNSSAEEVWKKRKYMSGTKGAPCTNILKKEARYQFEKNNAIDYHVLGFTSDEHARHNLFVLTERENLLSVLIDEWLTKQDCFTLISEAGIKVPEIYLLGYPNANCIGCVKATSPTYWNHVRKMHPDVFDSRANLSREIGCRLTRVKGKRIFLDELPPDAKGRPMKNMTIECNIFCEEKIKSKKK